MPARLTPAAQALLDTMGSFDWGGIDALEFRAMSAQMVQPADPADRIIRRDVDAGGVPARLYRREEAADLGEPVLLFLHGGGYIACSLDSHERMCSRLARLAGCAILSVDYRLAPEHVFPAAVEDATTALEWLTHHAATLDLDATRIAIGGDSAGGTLAAVTAIRARDNGKSPVIHQLLIYPGTDLADQTQSERDYATGFFLDAEFAELCITSYLPNASDRAHPWASPLRTQDLAGLPPATILVAECDPLRDEGAAYAARLRDAGVVVNYHQYAGMFHGFFGMFDILPEAHAAIADAAAALARAFRGEAT